MLFLLDETLEIYACVAKLKSFSFGNPFFQNRTYEFSFSARVEVFRRFGDL